MRHYCGTSLAAIRFIYLNHVFKVYRNYPKVNKDGHCGYGKLCGCFGDAIEELTKFRIYDLTEDPYEDFPISETSER